MRTASTLRAEPAGGAGVWSGAPAVDQRQAIPTAEDGTAGEVDAGEVDAGGVTAGGSMQNSAASRVMTPRLMPSRATACRDRSRQSCRRCVWPAEHPSTRGDRRIPSTRGDRLCQPPPALARNEVSGTTTRQNAPALQQRSTDWFVPQRLTASSEQREGFSPAVKKMRVSRIFFTADEKLTR